MEGRTHDQIRDKYTDMYTTALLTNWKVWPLAQVRFRTSRHVKFDIAIVDKFPIYAFTVQNTISVCMWCLLDALPLHS